MKNWDTKLFFWILLCVLIFFYLKTANEKNKTIEDFISIEDTIYYSKVFERVRQTDEGKRISKEIHIGIEERRGLVVLDYSNHKDFKGKLLSSNNIGKRIRLYVAEDGTNTISDPAQIEIEEEIIVPFSHRQKFYNWINKLILFFIIIF
mgnify:FL=1